MRWQNSQHSQFILHVCTQVFLEQKHKSPRVRTTLTTIKFNKDKFKLPKKKKKVKYLCCKI